LRDRGRRLRNDRAAADGVREDIDPAVLVDHPPDRRRHLRAIERVGDQAVGGTARAPDRADHLIQHVLVDLDGHDGAALATDDLGGRPPDAAARGRDQRDSSREPHRIVLFLRRASAGGAPAPRRPAARNAAAER
jgi:hypothetical protein